MFALLIVNNVKFNLHVHAWFDVARVVFTQFGLLVLLSLLSSEWKRLKICLKKYYYLHCSIFSMPRIPNNLRQRAICMLDASMSTEHVSRHVGCSSWVIINLRIRFQTTWSTNDMPRSGRPRITTRGQNRYIMNTHLRNRFQTATATAANTPGLHNIRENSLHARRPDVGCVLTQRHRQNRINWARVHTRWIRRRWNTVLFSDESRFSLQRGDRVRVYRRRNERYADCCVLERDHFGGGGSVMVWAAIAHGYRSPLVVIDGNLNVQRYRDDNLAHHVIP